MSTRPNQRSSGRRPEAIGWIARAWKRSDSLVYAAFALACAVYAAASFYGYLLLQTHGSWSAPLDDVFIHFDYARSFARGYPLQWSEGNGFSSGNTSLTYPLVLGIGYWVGFRDLRLMLWAAVVAVASVVGLLWLGRRLLDPRHAGLAPWVKYLLPPVVLSMGALDWTLWSGMENAFHLGVWAWATAVALRQAEAADDDRAARRGWHAGLVCALLVATRPESVVCVAALGFYCAWARRRIRRRAGRPFGWRGLWATLVPIGVPGALLVLLQAAVNRLLTGEASANGAIAKLLLNNPYMSPGEMVERYLSLLRYIIPRLVEHHFADARPWGYLVPAVALVPLAVRRTRPIALLLWGQIVAWLLLVGLNNQLRWHNERYAMPAVAWLLVLGAAGLGMLAGGWRDEQRAPTSSLPTDPAGATGRDERRSRLGARRQRMPGLARLGALARVVGVVLLAALYWRHQEPRMRDQIWFFGRASRNILDQHVATGRLLGQLKVDRVLVGDAGAITYASDRPGLDLIGLGGYHDLPFARATVHGLGAAIELIERIPEHDRPDVMAIYPSWWGDLPVFFGRYVTAFPVVGNVICGGAEKVVYEADWRALDGGGRPRGLVEGEWVFDELDVADLLSERAHRYGVHEGRLGFVDYRVLSDPRDAPADLFDAGRIVPPGAITHMRLTAPRGPARLRLRSAPSEPTTVALRLGGTALGELTIGAAKTTWVEDSIDLPATTAGGFELELTAVDRPWVSYHVWVTSVGGATTRP